MRYGIMLVAAVAGAALSGCERTDLLNVAPETACDKDYAAIKATEMIEIEYGLSIYSRFVREELSEDELGKEQIRSLDRMQAILDSRNRPVDLQDLLILDSANAKLSDPSVWNRADDRKCDPQDKTYSLYCALYFGSIDTVGEYQHRRTALQELRFVIEDAVGEREFEHRMMGFNNLPGTSFDDIRNLLRTTRERVQSRLKLQANCAL